MADASPVRERHGEPAHAWRLGIAMAMLAAAVVVGITVGSFPELRPGVSVGETEAKEFAGDFNGIGSLAVATGTLFLGWAATGRWLLAPLAAAIRAHRVGLHTWTSMAALSMATIHSFAFWTAGDLRGNVSGTLGLVMLVGTFVTGWWRTALVRSWGVGMWRVVHWELCLAVLGFGGLHWLGLELASGG